MHRFFFAFICFALASTPAIAIQIFPGGIVQDEKTLPNPNLAQNGTIRLNGTATFSHPLAVTIPFVNTGSLNPSLWATAPEITISLLQAEGDLSGGYSLAVSNVNHNTFSLTIRPNKKGVSLRKIMLSYLAVGHHS
jgi:hypothetical protein